MLIIQVFHAVPDLKLKLPNVKLSMRLRILWKGAHATIYLAMLKQHVCLTTSGETAPAGLRVSRADGKLA